MGTPASDRHLVEARAREAFEAYAASLAGQEAARTLGALAAASLGVTVAVPRTGLGYQRGPGALAAADAWRRASSFTGAATAVGLAVGHVLTSGDPVASFEYELEGQVQGEPYSTHACVVFEWNPAGELSEVREYYGDNSTPPESFDAYGLRAVFEPRPGQQIVPGKPPTLSTTVDRGEDETALSIAQRAYDSFAVSVADGDWGAYMDLMDPRVSFSLPIPGRMRGVQHGAAAAAEYHRWRWEDLGMRADLTQQTVMANGPTVAVEFDTLGVIGPGMPVHHWAVYVFDVQGDKVVGFREYNGDERTPA